MQGKYQHAEGSTRPSERPGDPNCLKRKTGTPDSFEPIDFVSSKHHRPVPNEFGGIVNTVPSHSQDQDQDNGTAQSDLPVQDATSSRKVSNVQNKICYGMLHEVRVKVLQQAQQFLKVVHAEQHNREELKRLGIIVFELIPGVDREAIFLQPQMIASKEHHQPTHVAVVNSDITNTLFELDTFCTFEAYSFWSQWVTIAIGASPVEKTTNMLVDIVIYGLQKDSKEVGNYLGGKKLFLQRPDYWQSDIKYTNPHIIDLNSISPDVQVESDLVPSSFMESDHEAFPTTARGITITQAVLEQTVALAFENTTRAQSLRRIIADIRIRTPLLPHQEEALDFINQRETGPVSEEFTLWKPSHPTNDTSKSTFRHSITGEVRHERPLETGGGILADDMGLGKTLTMLAAVVRTGDAAFTFASGSNSYIPSDTPHPLIPSPATLVVVPSSLLISMWLHEITRHCDGISNINTYHGRGREKTATVLANSGIVLSTYHTIASELDHENSPLWKVKWFRIVLDEAHIIRRRSTHFFTAVKRLHAKHYWCLTGTPIQNSLEDLGTLLCFIQASPLDDHQVFRKYLISPLMNGSENAVSRLRQLLDSVCLRRTQRILSLPEAIVETRHLKFSTREEEYYSRTRKMYINMIRKGTLKSDGINHSFGIFQLHLQLRLICNHGTCDNLSRKLDHSDAEEAFKFMSGEDEAKCEVCGDGVTMVPYSDEERAGSFTVCGHLLCKSCTPNVIGELVEVNGKAGWFQCSLCPETVSGNYILSGESSLPIPEGTEHSDSALKGFNENGFSSKVAGLVADLNRCGKREKSIVFSCWTRTLDLVGMNLAAHNMSFVRVDGTLSLAQRQSILERYRNDLAINILIMTTGTGAVGLNLSIANCVYVLEPQWNPMVEAQAIARVLRLGQTREVKVVRYLMKNTVEEEMQSQQRRKLMIARVGWENSA